MQISEQELRAMIRTAIASQAVGDPGAPQAAASADASPIRPLHASHGQFFVTGSTDGACVIEPDHRCDHCGYCKSLGH